MSTTAQLLADAQADREARERTERSNTDNARYELSLAGLGRDTITDLLARARAHKDGLASAISPTCGRVWVQYAGSNGVYGIIRSHNVD